ncbi:MAG TPA: FAD-dependent monooxygenase [Micromonosporaceae bacterium]|jgi:2-polyprenyl-6-methoxyphenol hydroxylase-like FAD-dependent oxidoreductase
MRGAGVRVLIVGAGIAGLASARTLSRWGADVKIVEHAPATTTDGTGIYLPGNAVRAIDSLGLGAEVAQRAVRIQRQRFADHRGRLLFDIDVDDVWKGVGACLALHRATLHQVLLAGAGDVTIHWGRTTRAMAVDDGGVLVEFGDGATDHYDLVLGADGLHSTVRRLVFDAAEPRPVGQHARRFVVNRPDSAPTWSVLLGPGSSFLTIPIGDGRLYCYCDGPIGNRVPPMRQLLARYAQPVPDLLDALDALDQAGDGGGTVHTGTVDEVVLDSWSHGAVLLIGDAAHATSPNMAQGAAMALEDALVLAECLAAAGGIAEALAAYERRRRTRTDWVLRQTHRRDRARALHPAVRNVVLRRFGRRIFRENYRPLRERA